MNAQVANYHHKNYPEFEDWGEANLVARALVASGDYKSAYGVLSDTGLTTGTEFSESEFLAGWVALRKLNRPMVAITGAS